MRFLVPVDFTEITNPLLRLVKGLAQAHQAEITLLHVVPPVLYLPYPESFGMSPVDLQLLSELQETRRAEAREKLSGLAEFLKPLKVNLQVEVGEPAEVILEREKDYNLLFVGSHRKGMVERILLGSTTEKVVKYSHGPVFVFKGKEPERIKRVLVGYDLSEDARRALEFACQLLRPFAPELLLLHVEETIRLPLVENVKTALWEKYREEKLKHLQKLVEDLREQGFEADFKLLEDGSPAEGIRSFLKENPHIDMVVLGSRGLSGLKRVLIGSTCSELLRTLEVPMLIHRGQG